MTDTYLPIHHKCCQWLIGSQELGIAFFLPAPVARVWQMIWLVLTTASELQDNADWDSPHPNTIEFPTTLDRD